MVGSFPRIGWMIQGGNGGRDGETKRRSGRGCAAWGWGEESSVGVWAQRRGCAHEVGFTMSVADTLTLQSQGQWHEVGATPPRGQCHPAGTGLGLRRLDRCSRFR
jgi:hypothetical protein